VYENNPSLLKDYETQNKKALERILRDDEEIYLFVNYPFESMDDEIFAKHFKILKTAVKNHEYKTIFYNYMQKEVLEDVKCLKIIYTDNNWYVAVETKEEKLRLLRIAFIEKLAYSKKLYFHKNVLEKYTKFFKNIQNAMSHNKNPKTAKLLASKNVAIYFKKGMKKFFPSQKYIKTLDDGSVEFSIDYTNEMEILPFIKKWLPDIKILEPQELKNRFLDDVKKCLTF
jgi:predicted DNA-binding transcriptional regulator YafY